MPKRWKRQLRREQGKTAAVRLKQVNAWTVNDVCLVLNSVSMGEYVPAIKSKEVNGSVLTSLSAENLEKSLGFDPVDAVKLLQFMQERQEQESVTEASPEKNSSIPTHS